MAVALEVALHEVGGCGVVFDDEYGAWHNFTLVLRLREHGSFIENYCQGSVKVLNPP